MNMMDKQEGRTGWMDWTKKPRGCMGQRLESGY